MFLPKLYARSNAGAVIEWTIEVENDGYRIISGQEKGQKVTSAWRKCDAKNVGKSNATTAEEQAVLEAQAKWDKKLKSKGYFVNRADIDKDLGFIEPMLAKEFLKRLDKIDWQKGVLVQNKLNGFRCVATFNGSEVELKSRTGEKHVSVPHISADLLKFFKEHPTAILDGELFNNDLRQQLNEISKLLRKTEHISAEDLARSEQLIRYHVYDGYDMNPEMGKLTPYIARKTWLDKHLPAYSQYYREVPSVLAHSKEEVDEIFLKYVQDGQEGVIIRVPDAPYENKRSKYLLKYKPEDSAECLILDVIEGEGNWAGCAKTATVKWNNKIFDATFKGSQEQCREVLENKKDWINAVVTFLYIGLSGPGTPNFGRIDLNNCFEGKK